MVRRNWKEIPTFTQKLEKGQVEAKHTDRQMALRWMGRKVCMLTTLHENIKKPTGKTDRQTLQLKMKPHSSVEYNKNMGAVDRCDMKSSIECIIKSIKWYKKLFFKEYLQNHCCENLKSYTIVF
jgi:hypothetical protein